MDGDSVREAIRCQSCGLVQFRTRTGNCRRCLRQLPSRVKSFIPPEEPQEISDDAARLFAKPTNIEAVEKIGRRIQQLRKSRGLTQNQLRKRSRVSRSYLARVESGVMTPSLGTVEKISKALGIALNNFFVSDLSREALLEDPFIYGLQPFLRQLDGEQWQSVLQRLAAINN
jgi:transcriptional regulator with XRE-family HTH domain